MAINNTLRRLRLESGLTQEQVAEHLNVTRQTVSSYESGRTRPDIDTLMRFAEIYGTDLEGIVYGNAKNLKATKTVKITAYIAFVIPVLMKLIGSVFLLYTHHYYYPPPAPSFSQYFKLLDISEIFDGFAYQLAQFIFLALFLVVLLSKCKILIRTKLIYSALFVAAMLLVSVPFSIADPVFSLIDYMFMPLAIITTLIFFLVADLIIEFICDVIKSSKKA